MQLSPLLQYQGLLDAGSALPDSDQLAAVKAINSLWLELQNQKEPSFWQRLSGYRSRSVNGLYLWGGVGRGKTWLMDLFFHSLSEPRKRRVHFHRFMQSIHQELTRLDGVQDPLAIVAADWARKYRVLCLDEFFVSDIADAMLLGGLLENLFAAGVTLVTTSNIEPDKLYRDGLQRARFLPAIALLKNHTRVLQLKGDLDFRLRILEQSVIYHWPLDSKAQEKMLESYERMAAGRELSHELTIEDRPFQAIRRRDGIIWFSFSELCEKARGAVDFIELARAFKTVFISGIPQLHDEDSNAARRFIILVDEFYDRGVKLLLSADSPLETLYTGKRLAFEFERTVSRLSEMQTSEYLSRPHLA